jgi:hypothetical protein
MGKFRIEYESGVNNLSICREELFIIVHYASLQNNTQAKKLYYAGETEYIYRSENQLPLNGLSFYESHQTYWNISDLQEVVSFLNDTLIPNLEISSNKNLIDILGGWQSLIDNIDTGSGYKHRFGILSQGNSYENVSEYIYILKTLKDIIVSSIIMGVPYYINYIE